jgi:hypothetical protein
MSSACGHGEDAAAVAWGMMHSLALRDAAQAAAAVA